MARKYPVSGDQYRTIDKRMCGIKQQLLQRHGSPLDPAWIAREIQRLSEPRKKPEWPIWKTIITGGRSGAELLTALEGVDGMTVSQEARSVLQLPLLDGKNARRDTLLARTTLAELGFCEGVTLAKIQQITLFHDLYPCPLDTGAQLLLQHCTDLEPTAVLMSPVTVPNQMFAKETPMIHVVGVNSHPNNGFRSLTCLSVDTEIPVHLDFLFELPKPKGW